ncbi:MAG TPA: hypothetical protein VJ770_17625 [Stellaceae bacterium]|nr:hypothetical protein [Stellaceae bacterium]
MKRASAVDVPEQAVRIPTKKRLVISQVGINGDPGPDRGEEARLIVQSAVGPFDRLFEASRDEMSG